MTHTPADAKFLTEEEKIVALRRMVQDSHGATDTENVKKSVLIGIGSVWLCLRHRLGFALWHGFSSGSLST